MEVYVLTAIGVGIDTETRVFRRREDALAAMRGCLDSYAMTDVEEMCRDCLKGYSGAAACDVELQLHRCAVE